MWNGCLKPIHMRQLINNPIHWSWYLVSVNSLYLFSLKFSIEFDCLYYCKFCFSRFLSRCTFPIRQIDLCVDFGVFAYIAHNAQTSSAMTMYRKKVSICLVVRVRVRVCVSLLYIDTNVWFVVRVRLERFAWLFNSTDKQPLWRYVLLFRI